MEQFQADIEHSSHKSKARFNVNLNAMMDFLGVANDGHHRERGFNHHAVIPGATSADFDVIGNALSTAEPPVGEHNFVPIAQVIQKGVIRDVHFVPNPASDLSEGVEYPSHLNADTPATFIAALGPNLLLAAALPDRKDEFNGKTIDHIEHCVPVYALVGKEIYPIIRSSDGNTDTPASLDDNWVSASGAHINNPQSGSRWSAALELLTKQDNLQKLTLVSLRGIVPLKGLLSPTKRWCDECYDEARSNGKPVYDRLIWKFESVSVYTHHQRILRDQCPFPECQKAIPHLTGKALAGFCPYCHRWLGKVSPDLACKDTALDPEFWVAEKRTNEAIFDLLQATSNNPSVFGNQVLSKSFGNLLGEVFDGNLSAFSRALGVTTRAARHYSNGSLPSFPVVLTLSNNLNLSLVQIYSANFDSDYIARQATKYPIAIPG